MCTQGMGVRYEWREGSILTISSVKVIPWGREVEGDIRDEGSTAKVIDASGRVTQLHCTQHLCLTNLTKDPNNTHMKIL